MEYNYETRTKDILRIHDETESPYNPIIPKCHNANITVIFHLISFVAKRFYIRSNFIFVDKINGFYWRKKKKFIERLFCRGKDIFKI